MKDVNTTIGASMTETTTSIDTSAELLENDILPKIKEVHTDPSVPCASEGTLPKALAESTSAKSPAQWAYERIIMYIQRSGRQDAADPACQSVERHLNRQPQAY